MAGVESTGFVKKSYATIKEDFLDGVESLISPLARQAFASAQAAANKLLVIQERIADLWDLGESVYNAMYPDTASGASLDGAAALTGTTRLAATYSVTTSIQKTTAGTTIAAGKQVRTGTLGDVFETTEAITSSATAAAKAWVDLNGVAATGAYTITVNGTPFTYGATVPPDDETAILDTNLKATINAGAEPVTATYTGGKLEILGDTDAETSLPETFTITVTANLAVEHIGTLQAMQAVSTGPVVALADNLTDIVTPVAGWAESTNPNAATLGNDEETDAELRLRRADSLANPGSGTVDAIRAALLEVSSVTAAFVLNNRTDAVDANGLPAHSFRALVLGGLTADIAEAIWAHCDAGDYIDGSTVVTTITDTQGYQQTVRFDRPTEVLMWVEFTVVEDTELGTLPDDYEDQLESAVVAWGATEQIGHDSLPDQIKSYAIAQVPGIKTLAVRVTDQAGYPGSYQTTPWTIDADELTKWAASRVEFV